MVEGTKYLKREFSTTEELLIINEYDVQAVSNNCWFAKDK